MFLLSVATDAIAGSCLRLLPGGLPLPRVGVGVTAVPAEEDKADLEDLTEAVDEMELCRRARLQKEVRRHKHILQNDSLLAVPRQ